MDEVRAVPLGSLLPKYGQKAFEIIQREGISAGVATRLLTLARPDIFMSVNGRSQQRLAQTSGLTVSQIRESSGYGRLIEWVLQSKWWGAPRPSGTGWDSQRWPYRAALMDVPVREDIDQG